MPDLMGQTIVVVDDDPEVLEFLELLLSLQGAEVVSSDDTGDVVEMIARTQPALVLLDLQNGRDRQAGLTVLAGLRAAPMTAAIPVFLMTADHTALEHRSPYLQQHGASLLLKPFKPDRLVKMIGQVLV